jgi:dTMP kinase
MGDSVILRSHPETDNPFGRRAKRALLGRGKLNRIRASVYYALDVIRSIRHYYGSTETFIVVRYLVGVAYLPPGLARIAYRFFVAFLPTSRYMFFLDVTPEEAVKRMATRDEKEMFENREELVKVRKTARALVSSWHVIDTSGSIADTQKAIAHILNCLDGMRA